MAKTTLPVNYKDDVLTSSMDGKRRYRMINNTDGTVSFEDATTYTQIGSNFGAANLNATNGAVNAAADASKIIDNVNDIKANTQAGYITGAKVAKEIISDLGGFEFSVAADGTPMYKPGGADTALPFKGNCILAYSKMFSPIEGSSEKIFTCKIGDILIKADDINNDLDRHNLEFSGGCSFKTLFSNSMSSHYRTTRFVVYQCTIAGELTVRFPIRAEYHHSSIAIIRT